MESWADTLESRAKELRETHGELRNVEDTIASQLDVLKDVIRHRDLGRENSDWADAITRCIASLETALKDLGEVL